MESAYDIVSASTGHDAIKELRASPNIKFVIMDVSLPDMTGEELRKKLKEHEPSPYFITLETGSSGNVHPRFYPPQTSRYDSTTDFDRDILKKRIETAFSGALMHSH